MTILRSKITLTVCWLSGKTKNNLFRSDRVSFSSFLAVHAVFSRVQAMCVKFNATVNNSVMYLDKIQCALLAVSDLSIQVWVQYLT